MSEKTAIIGAHSQEVIDEAFELVYNEDPEGLANHMEIHRIDPFECFNEDGDSLFDYMEIILSDNPENPFAENPEIINVIFEGNNPLNRLLEDLAVMRNPMDIVAIKSTPHHGFNRKLERNNISGKQQHMKNYGKGKR